MRNGQGQTDYLAFLDECGDHSLVKIDHDFPIFVLSLVLVKREDYVDTILPELNGLKLRYWDHEGVNLHSRDIRKASGPFTILQKTERRERFVDELSNLMDVLPYKLFIVCIRKDKHHKQYVDAMNPYELALIFVMERLIFWMEQNNQTFLPIVAEARGKNEDNTLKAAFFDLASHGTNYVSSERFQQCQFPLQFHDKRKNIAGIQLADLCAHPSARHILKPDQHNRAFEVVKKHIYEGSGRIRGWKIFP